MTRLDKTQKTLNSKLFIRILPTTDFNYEAVKIDSSKEVLYVRCLQDLAKGVNGKNPNYWSFCTDGIFWNSSQDDIYETVTSNMYEDVFDGVSGVILSYGQTGSGKTFTTSGLRFPFLNRGLILRVLSQLFDESEQRQDVVRVTFGLSYLEFIGESVKDLIKNKPVDKLMDVQEYPLVNEVCAWKQIFTAECNKSYATEAPYMGSNRGHSVLTFYVHAESLIDTDPVITHSKIHIVDMAGTGNYGSSSSNWKDKWSVGQSNLSKCLMEQLIMCLTGSPWKNEGHICPYKSSRFLTYLHDTLRPSCLIRFIAHIKGNEESLPLTISTLKFSEKLKGFKPEKLERILEPSCILRMRNLERECQRLKEEAELLGMLRETPNYCNLSQDRLLQIKRAAQDFLFGRLENLTLCSFGQTAITLEVFKDMYERLSTERDQMIKDAIATATEMLQAQLATERNASLPSPVVPNTQRMSRRKSRQQDSQLTFGSTFRTDSDQRVLGRTSSVVQQAGVGDRRGISIGPGKVSGNYEGNITKVFKKLKSKRSDSLVIKTGRTMSTKDVGVSLSKNQMTADEAADLSLPPSFPSRESAWQSFCSDNPDLSAELRKNVENAEELAKTSRKKYRATMTELSQLREEYEESKSELENCRHIRQIYGKCESDVEGNPLPGNLEREAVKMLSQKEEQLNACIENCHVALIDFKSFTDQVNEAKKALEDAFQNYCKTNYKFVFPPEETVSTDLKADEAYKESPCPPDFKQHPLVLLYTHLQQKLVNYTPKKMRKEWRNY